VTRRARATAAIGLLEGLRWKAATRNSHLCDGNCQCNCQCNCGISVSLAWLVSPHVSTLPGNSAPVFPKHQLN
jgi:hypothetical protein